MFSDKVTLAHLIRNLGMPGVNCIVHTLGSVNLDALKKKLGSDVLVFQTPFGSSGTGTFYIEDETDLATLGMSYPPDTLFKVARYISGPSYSLTGFVSPSSLHWLPPALQVIGSSVAGALARSTTVYAGSDFFVSNDIEKRYVDWDLFERLAVHFFPPAFSREVKENCVMVNAVSKNYAMTGWRLGYGAGPAHVISAMLRVQALNTGCPSTISQRAAIQALTGSQEYSFEMASRFQARKDVMEQGLGRIPGISFAAPQDAFYVFCNFSAYLPGQHRGKRVETATDLCLLFLEQAHVASFPGEAFGTPGHIRFSFAVSREKIKKALNKIATVLSEIQSDTDFLPP